MIGVLTIIGVGGGMEWGTLSPIGAFIGGVVGLALMYSPIKDGSIYRLIDNKIK
jgi:hypothetical protein